MALLLYIELLRILLVPDCIQSGQEQFKSQFGLLLFDSPAGFQHPFGFSWLSCLGKCWEIGYPRILQKKIEKIWKNVFSFGCRAHQIVHWKCWNMFKEDGDQLNRFRSWGVCFGIPNGAWIRQIDAARESWNRRNSMSWWPDWWNYHLDKSSRTRRRRNFGSQQHKAGGNNWTWMPSWPSMPILLEANSSQGRVVTKFVQNWNFTVSSIYICTLHYFIFRYCIFDGEIRPKRRKLFNFQFKRSLKGIENQIFSEK